MKKINAIVFVAVLMFSIPLFAQTVPISGVKGIETVTVQVDKMDTLGKKLGLNPDVYKAFLEEELKTVGIPYADGDHPILSLKLMTVKPFLAYATSYSMTLRTWVHPEDAPNQRILATVWQRQGLVYARKSKVPEELNAGIREGLQRLAEDLKEAN